MCEWIHWSLTVVQSVCILSLFGLFGVALLFQCFSQILSLPPSVCHSRQFPRRTDHSQGTVHSHLEFSHQRSQRRSESWNKTRKRSRHQFIDTWNREIRNVSVFRREWFLQTKWTMTVSSILLKLIVTPFIPTWARQENHRNSRNVSYSHSIERVISWKAFKEQQPQKEHDWSNRKQRKGRALFPLLKND